MSSKLVVVLGPTAAGKTSLAAHLAFEFNGEIISADSRQVYRGMDIGTGKDLSDYLVNNKQINYHLIDIAEPAEEFDLFTFKKKFIDSYRNIVSAGKTPFLVGGTGMYLSAIVQNYKLKEGDFSPEAISYVSSLGDEELRDRLTELKSMHNISDLVSRERMVKALLSNMGSAELSFPVQSCVIGVLFKRDELKNRITARLKQRLDSGMIEEVKSLIQKGISLERLLFFGLEYRYIALYLNGDLSYNDMFQKLNSSIHSFAKRQMTWFRKMEKEGVMIHWVENGEFIKSKEIIERFLKDD
jgi:tRNA dimethylallyltransferase